MAQRMARASPRRRLRVAVGDARWALPAGILVAATTVPSILAPPETGLDGSWRAAIHLAAARGLDFGPEVLWTYGPLGFLTVPGFYFTSTAALAYAFNGLVQTLLGVTLIYCASRSFHPVLAAAIAFAVASLPMLRADLLLLIVFAFCVLALQGRLPSGTQRWLLPVAAVASAIEFLIRLHIGLLALVMVGVTAWIVRPSRVRAVLEVLGAFAVGALVFWFAAGNPAGAIWPWVDGSVEITLGYTDALAQEEPGRMWELWLAAALVGGFGALLWRQSTRLSRSRRGALLALVGLFVYAMFKGGFVQHAGDHSLFFFSSLAAAAVFVAWDGRLRWLALAVTAATVATSVSLSGAPPLSLFNPRPSLDAARADLETLTNAQKRDSLAEAARERMRAILRVDGATLRELAGHTVHVSPHETSLIWAFDLPWRPVPVFQTYATYTEELDEKNAAVLMSSRAPQRVLRERLDLGLERRNPIFESPAYFLALVCHYRELRAGERWQVLAPTRSRCSLPRRVASVEAVAAKPVPIPPAASPDELLFARLRLDVPLTWRLRTALYKPPTVPVIVLDGVDRYRLVMATAVNPLLLRIPAAVGFARAYGGSLERTSVSVEGVPSPFRIDFFRVRVKAAPEG